MQAQLDEIIENQREKEEKKDNVMLFNVPESEKLEASEGAQDDMELVKEILSHVSPDLSFDSLPSSSVSRIGERKNDATRPRPIKMKLAQPEQKVKLLKSSRRLKNYTRHEKIGLSSDKTKKERLQDQYFRNEIDRIRRADPTADPVVFRGKIMQRSQKQSILNIDDTRRKLAAGFGSQDNAGAPYNRNAAYDPDSEQV